MRAGVFVIFSLLLALTVSGQVNYTISGDTAYVSSAPTASGDIVIAATYNGYPVTSIGDDAFLNRSGVTSVTMPDSITNIGAYAFQKTHLTSIVIPTGVTAIGTYAFAYTQLKSVAIPDNVTRIGAYAFQSCTNLTTLTLGSNLTVIAPYAFASCGRLSGVTIPNHVSVIDSYVFSWCANMTNVTLGDSVGVIGDHAFYNCIGLTVVPLPQSVYNIGASSFRGCAGLTNATIPDGVVSVGTFAFTDCIRLAGITFRGNAPAFLGTGPFNYVPATTKVCYYYGTTGWGQSFGGLATLMLGAPPAQVGPGSVGSKSNGFGFTINGVTNQTIVVDASTDLLNWQPVWTNTLLAAYTNFVDPRSLNYPQRFYRMRSN